MILKKTQAHSIDLKTAQVSTPKSKQSEEQFYDSPPMDDCDENTGEDRSLLPGLESLKRYAYMANFPFKIYKLSLRADPECAYGCLGPCLLPASNLSYLPGFPEFILINILKFLSFKSLIRMLKCSKIFLSILTKDVVWKYKLFYDYGLNLKFPQSSYFYTYRFFVQSDHLRHVAAEFGDVSDLNRKLWFLSSFIYSKTPPYPSMNHLSFLKASSVFGIPKRFLNDFYVVYLDEYLSNFNLKRNGNVTQLIQKAFCSQRNYGLEYLLFPIRDQCQQFMVIDSPHYKDILFDPERRSYPQMNYKWPILYELIKATNIYHNKPLDQHIIYKCYPHQTLMDLHFRLYYITAIFVRKMMCKFIVQKEIKFINSHFNKVIFFSFIFLLF